MFEVIQNDLNSFNERARYPGCMTLKKVSRYYIFSRKDFS